MTSTRKRTDQTPWGDATPQGDLLLLNGQSLNDAMKDNNDGNTPDLINDDAHYAQLMEALRSRNPIPPPKDMDESQHRPQDPVVIRNLVRNLVLALKNTDGAIGVFATKKRTNSEGDIEQVYTPTSALNRIRGLPEAVLHLFCRRLIVSSNCVFTNSSHLFSIFFSNFTNQYLVENMQLG